MISSWMRVIGFLVATWVRLYSFGLPPEIRQSRLEEVSSDLWDHFQDRLTNGRRGFQIALELLGRWIRGIPQDVFWRFSRVGADPSFRNQLDNSGIRLGMPFVDGVKDLRIALRQLRKSPVFAFTVILTLALAIGATTALFSVVNAVVLRSLPYPEPEQLVSFWADRTGASDRAVTYSEAEFLTIEERNHTLQAIAGYVPEQIAAITLGEGAVPIVAAQVTANFGLVLGTPPEIGRGFSVEDDLPGASPVALVSHALWITAFNGSPNVLGDQITINGDSHTIIGVMPPGFGFPDHDTDLWRPLRIDRSRVEVNSGQYIRALGRVGRGVALPALKDDLARLSAQITEESLTRYAGTQFHVSGLQRELTGGVASPLLLLFVLAAVVLLVACFNLAGILLSRSITRKQELALRSALGASRSRIIRQLLTENLALAVLGGLGGVVLASFGIDFLVSTRPAFLPRVEEVRLDLAAIGFAVLIACGAVVLLVVPVALRSSGLSRRSNLGTVRTFTESHSNRRLRDGIVMVQVAVSVALVSAAGLMTRSLLNLGQVDPGFQTEDMLTFRIHTPESVYPDPVNVGAFYQDAVEAIRQVPGVREVGSITQLPLTGRSRGYAWPEGASPEAGFLPPELGMRWITSGYFDAMRIPLLQGRFFDGSDAPGSTSVAVVSRSLAEAIWPDQDPIGRRFGLGRIIDSHMSWFTVIGVVGEVRHSGLDQDHQPIAYFPQSQMPIRTQYVVVATTVDPEEVLPAVRDAVRALDAAQPLYDLRTMDDVVGSSLSIRRFTASLLNGFAAIALILAVTGLYGLMSYSASQRNREIGIRKALGATRSRIRAMMVGKGLSLLAGGLLFGIGFAVLVTRFLGSLLFQLSSFDPLTLLVTSVLIFAVALLACLLPAERAAAVQPQVVVRD